MTALSAQYALTQNTTVQQNVRMGMLSVALSIAGEAQGSQSITKFNKRHDLSVRVLNDPDHWMPRFLQAGVALDPPAGYGTDALIIAGLTAVFDRIAGVSSLD